MPKYIQRQSKFHFNGHADHGFANLDWNINIGNGTNVTPTFVYNAKDATLTDWEPHNNYGQTLTLGGSGDDPTLSEGTPMFGSLDDGIRFKNGKKFTNSSFYVNPGTDDIVFECYCQLPSAPDDKRLVSIYDGIQQGRWELYSHNVNSQFSFEFRDADNDTATISIPSYDSDPDTWWLIHVFLKAGDTAAIFGNGKGPYSVSASSIGSISSNEGLGIGGRPVGENHYNANFGFAAWWQGAGLLDGYDQSSWVQERYMKFFGFYNSNITYSFGRDTYGYSEKKEGGRTRLYKIGDDAPLLSYVDYNGELQKGIYIGSDIGNSFSDPTDFSAWSKTNAADTISTNVKLAPNNLTEVDSITTDSADGQKTHGILQQVTVTETYWCFSVFAAKGDQDYIALHQSTDNIVSWFSLNDGSLGSSIGSPYTMGTIYYGTWNGLDIYRVYMSYLGTAEAKNHRILSANAFNDYTFVGTDDVSTYFWGAMLHPGTYPHMYYGASSRSADDFYVVNPLMVENQKSNIFIKYVSPLEIPESNRILYYLTDDGDVTNLVRCGLNNLSNVFNIAANDDVEQWSLSGSSVISGGNSHTTNVSFRPNRAIVQLENRNQGLIDINCTPAIGMNRLTIGSTGSGQ